MSTPNHEIITGPVVVMPNEDLEAYQQHLESFTDEYDPQGATESNLVQMLADASWRLNRAAALETNLLTPGLHNLDAQCKALATLSMHSQRLSRQFERTVTQLRALQEIRKTQEKEDLENYLDIVEMYEEKAIPYDPDDDGFVFSDSQIHAAMRARNREISISAASAHRRAA